MDDSRENIEGAAARYLPHAGPALMIRKVVESSEDSLLCIGRFAGENAMVRDGRVPCYLVAEPAAQAVATHLAILAVGRGMAISHLEGYLTGFKHMELTCPDLPADTDLLVRVTPRGGSRGLYKYRFRVELEGELVAQGEISTYVTV